MLGQRPLDFVLWETLSKLFNIFGGPCVADSPHSAALDESHAPNMLTNMLLQRFQIALSSLRSPKGQKAGPVRLPLASNSCMASFAAISLAWWQARSHNASPPKALVYVKDVILCSLSRRPSFSQAKPRQIQKTCNSLAAPFIVSLIVYDGLECIGVLYRAMYG